MEQRLSLVTLGVDDVAEGRAFYERLGWQASSASNAEVTFFQLGGIVLGLIGRAALAEDAGVAENGANGFSGTALAHNCRDKAGVDALLAEAEAAGGKIVKPARDASWGGYSGYFADHDGHLWEVAWNPQFPLAEDGTITLPD